MTSVIFFHGLESGPGGRKHRWLERQYPTTCNDMEVHTWRPDKSNSFLRVGLTSLFSCAPWNLPKYVLQHSLASCLGKQAEVLEAAGSDTTVLVGSSWGGAVATLALADGLWCGPCVLLAPAYGAVAKHGTLEDTQTPAEVYKRISLLPEDVR